METKLKQLRTMCVWSYVALTRLRLAESRPARHVPSKFICNMCFRKVVFWQPRLSSKQKCEDMQFETSCVVKWATAVLPSLD